jgi:alkaline phosphatase D
MPADVLPGTDGEVRIHYWRASGSDNSRQTTGWKRVSTEADFTCQIELEDLKANANYIYLVEARRIGDSNPFDTASGQFKTAPQPDAVEPVRFIVTTCEAIRSIDAGTEGHFTYRRMLEFKPDFLVHTGDIVYYDKAPLSDNLAEARAKWNLMFAYGHNRRFFQNTTAYFMKDDHDTLKNDCWPGQTYGELTFDEGLRIFREQVPMGKHTYRTYRWGKDVQIWLTENRDFRSPNTIPDGPEKTILGAKQKAWLKRTIRESDARYKFIISPGPLVGPDKPGKKDNHVNDVFAHEGQELRDFLSSQPGTYVICGDRHWQYLSEDPVTGLIEMGCGPINDIHDYGGNPGFQPAFHHFFSGKGGFLGVIVEDGKARAEWYGADPEDPGNTVPVIHYTHHLP